MQKSGSQRRERLRATRSTSGENHEVVDVLLDGGGTASLQVSNVDSRKWLHSKGANLLIASNVPVLMLRHDASGLLWPQSS